MYLNEHPGKQVSGFTSADFRATLGFVVREAGVEVDVVQRTEMLPCLLSRKRCEGGELGDTVR